ncbi:hypothetical protein EVAR_40468_1 [Eumeta japonica]|uniref:Uncharacterized protein n=1 Tax=Eumeta variegata TaxID=151549 RepID=A0A4C1WY45_EUMVA|nr:hypothetical protein EVAR_40468_1 [Eumeta japonica]
MFMLFVRSYVGVWRTRKIEGLRQNGIYASQHLDRNKCPRTHPTDTRHSPTTPSVTVSPVLARHAAAAQGQVRSSAGAAAARDVTAAALDNEPLYQYKAVTPHNCPFPNIRRFSVVVVVNLLCVGSLLASTDRTVDVTSPVRYGRPRVCSHRRMSRELTCSSG